MYTGFWWENLRDSDVDGRMIRDESSGGDMDWIDQADDRHRWWALVTAVMKLRVP